MNLSPENAQTYYELAVPGDPVTITGSPRAGTWGNAFAHMFKLMGVQPNPTSVGMRGPPAMGSLTDLRAYGWGRS